MIAATTPDIRIFMNHLLNGTDFDHFLLCEATIMTGSTYMIDGHINQAFYEAEDVHRTSGHMYHCWKEYQSLVYQMVKGTRTPLAMKIVLSEDAAHTAQYLQQYQISIPPEQISGLYLNIRYEQDRLYLSSGTALSVFTLDKTVEYMWDDILNRFFQQQGITLDT